MLDDVFSGSWHWVVTMILTPVALALGHVLGGWTPAMTTLLIIMGLDVLSGLARAYVQKAVSSSVSWNGMLKKFLVFVIIALACQIDLVMQSPPLLRNLIVTAFTISEALSVVENVSAAGLPVPEFLKHALAQLNEKKARPPSEGTNGT